MAGYYFGRNKELKRLRLIVVFTATLFLAILALASQSQATAFASSQYGECVMEVYSHRVLGGINLNVRLPMASTTKTMTALLAVESGKMDEIVTVPQCAVGVEGSSIYLKCGEQLPLRDLVYGLMLRSGNDAAETIACFLGGSVGGFADIMNNRAMEMGLEDTHFTNPHGLHDDEHFTSAYDLAVIASEGMKNAEFRAIASAKSYVSGNGENARYFTNKNKLLWRYEGGNGVKTGFTKRAGRCLVSAAERDGMQVVAVVLNVPSMFEECSRLMDGAFKNYKPISLFRAGEAICNGTFDGVYPRTIGLATHENVVVPITNDESVTTAIETYPNLTENGNEAGKIKIFVNERLLFCRPIYTLEEVDFLEKVK